MSCEAGSSEACAVRCACLRYACLHCARPPTCLPACPPAFLQSLWFDTHAHPPRDNRRVAPPQTHTHNTTSQLARDRCERGPFAVRSNRGRTIGL
mmetsp:Transcript_15459/g.39460  ORF Transcript_15459/g.39460 Transcript_15459/m.39460 type:complete len:95 (-) Transcript_15459:12-296(-)